ncbi:uncharacterized protein LOC103510095 [Diaphorina citri]|uniref:Uncharacterized protein LOC103510095 n=1 Tax=Diaphorina citri TaxID=121845 RepID=A0A3Q0IUT9_DIACI|nr:uncharacterized protein LOC103510095 [Diaphorina citri]
MAKTQIQTASGQLWNLITTDSMGKHMYILSTPQITGAPHFRRPDRPAEDQGKLKHLGIYKLLISGDLIPTVGQSVTVFGRPGGGAPQLTKSGKIRTKREEDPWLRFQFYGPTRHIVDEDLRYRNDSASKREYKQDLDDLIQEKKLMAAERMRLNEIHDRKMLVKSVTPARLKKAPNTGTPARKLGFNFEYSLGWSDEHVLQKIKQQLEDPQNKHKLPSIDGMKIGQTREEMLTGGVELVPLLAARRKQAIKWPLGHTDITRLRDHEVRPVWTLEGERKYHGDLDKQVTTKKEFSQEIKHKDLEQQKKHFDVCRKPVASNFLPKFGLREIRTQYGELLLVVE